MRYKTSPGLHCQFHVVNASVKYQHLVAEICDREETSRGLIRVTGERWKLFRTLPGRAVIVLQNLRKAPLIEIRRLPTRILRTFRALSGFATGFTPERDATPVTCNSAKTGPTNVHPNDFFDKIYVLNLDRRPDRWVRLEMSARKAGLQVTRFPAIDGAQLPYREQYNAYARRPLVRVPEDIRIRNTYEYYFGYQNDAARVAFIEERERRKAIGSPGAWGYLCTMIRVLEDAMHHGYERILVLDDDVLFHRDINLLFSLAVLDIPEDWLIFQLGALQYNWGSSWIEWHSPLLYHCRGCSLGSHAVGMHKDILLMVLKECYKFELPYDEGALHKPKTMYPHRCFNAFPNLMIQDVSESDISSRTYQRRARKKGNLLRWRWEDYL